MRISPAKGTLLIFAGHVTKRPKMGKTSRSLSSGYVVYTVIRISHGTIAGCWKSTPGILGNESGWLLSMPSKPLEKVNPAVDGCLLN
jgi:hypothetical protein